MVSAPSVFCHTPRTTASIEARVLLRFQLLPPTPVAKQLIRVYTRRTSGLKSKATALDYTSVHMAWRVTLFFSLTSGITVPIGCFVRLSCSGRGTRNTAIHSRNNLLCVVDSNSPDTQLSMALTYTSPAKQTRECRETVDHCAQPMLWDSMSDFATDIVSAPRK
ncbi:hypothetical protein CC80DRAFT_293383 [Byssothecium circinans]|uniref:Uncharacterized protein n=1 Tax=Byssothecium circinans TaxID=147558 RepID=A0A6A5U7T9_9PLEO|nr:hypothetical protein CC80DRAFT_293383 [Byssothecium circinans]